MKEVYLGNDEDQCFISSYLQLIRTVTPYEMFFAYDVKILQELVDNPASAIDSEFFSHITSFAELSIKQEY